MKKFLTLLAAAVTAMAAQAATYTGDLTVTVNGESAKQTGVIINVDQNNGLYTLSLNNFVLGGTMPVGNIVLTDLKAVEAGGMKVLAAEQNITIAAGDNSFDSWAGPGLGEIPVALSTAFTDNLIVTNIDINMESLGQVIHVTFDNTGDLFQIGNNGFEEWSSVSKPEPRHWHSFKHATGNLASMAGDHIFRSNLRRPGSTGQYSAVLTATKVLGIVANGTMTTGRLNAGNTSATHTDNHSYIDITNSYQADSYVDDFGDQFYTLLNARPDAINVWVKFYQQEFQSAHPYATMSAVITDGTRYQDPENQTYTNVAAKAANRQIAINNSAWQNLTVPFDYTSYAANNADPKALLITFSTNADPGQGSCKIEGGFFGIGGTIVDCDSLHIDDISLVYNADVTALNYKGQLVEGFDPAQHVYNVNIADDEVVSASDITFTVKGESAVSGIRVESTDNGYTAIVSAVSGDMQTINTYTINFIAPAKVYILGEVNGNSWSPMTPATQMESEDGSVYKAHVTTTGENGGSFFGFTTKLSDDEAGWEDIADYRIGPADGEDNFWITEELIGETFNLAYNTRAFRLPAGEWDFELNLSNMTLLVTGEAVSEPVTLYILGEVNGNTWDPTTGVQMTTEDNVHFTAEVTTAGENDGGSFFAFTTELAENNDNGGWAYITPFRFGPADGEDNFWITNDLVGETVNLAYNTRAFRLEAGTWKIEVNYDDFTLVVSRPGVMGDINGDGSVNVADINLMISIILGNDTLESYPAADINNDGTAGIADLNLLINIVLENQ